MSVQIFTTIQSQAPDVIHHDDAEHFERGHDGSLTVFGPPRVGTARNPYGEAVRDVVAIYAPGMWANAEILPSPEPVDARSFTVTMERGECVEGALRRTIAALADGAQILIDGQPVDEAAVNAAAEPKAYAHEPGCNTAHDGPAACPPPTEAVLSETSEPYVSVSVSANDSDELAKLIRKLIREKGAKSFGLVGAP